MKEVFTKQIELMKKYGFQAMVTLSPENTAYMIGTPVPSQINIRSRHVITICTPEHEPVVICVSIEEELVKKNSWISPENVFTYNEFLDDPIVLAADKLKKFGLTGKKVGIEFSYLPAKDYLTLMKAAPDIEFIDGSELLDGMRTIKFQYELDQIEAFAGCAEDVIFDAFDSVKAGDTEMDLYRAVSAGFSSIGGQKPGFCICSGERSSMLNATATDRVLRKGDMVRLDLVGTRKGYFCDVCRTAVVGEPSEEQSRLWDIIVDSHDNIIRQLKPGVNTHDVFEDYAQRFRATGYSASIDFVAHGLGISVHEVPYINSYAHNILKENMVMCVEPIYIVPGVGGFHLENEVFITKDGCRVISSKRPYKELPRIRA